MLRKALWIVPLTLAAIVGGVFLFLHKPRPQGKPGPAADALAKKVWKAVNNKAWQEMGALRWTFWGQSHHIWDRRRWFDQVTWGKGAKKAVVTFSLLEPHKGLATLGGREVTGKQLASLLKKAYEIWCNDSYWLNPLEKFFDRGVTRSIVEKHGKKMLFISFSSGGVTPGDAYLYELDPTGLPLRWWMWVSVFPIGGVEAKFENWKTLAGGGKVSTLRTNSLFSLRMEPIQGAKDIKTLVGSDIFRSLTQRFPGIRTKP